MDRIVLYHSGRTVVEKPDIRIGRKNADFGQGFYLSPDEGFSRRWARPGKDGTAWLNTYELDCGGLNIRRFRRDGEWFDYILGNRRGAEDILRDVDVIIGPIANDTIYDTFGLSTSGMLTREQALQMLSVGPVYTQVALRTERAASVLRFLGAQAVTPAEIAAFRETVAAEQEAFQREFARIMEREVE